MDINKSSSFNIDRSLLDMTIIDVDKFIKQHFYEEVTSYQIYEPGTKNFHKKGLFSTEIFGDIVSEDRFRLMGYINLNCKIIQPSIYFILNKYNKIYNNIMKGTLYVKFDQTKKEFIIVDNNDKDAQTGYNYFIKHIYDLRLPKKASSIRDAYRLVFEKFQKKKLLLTDKLLVLPAGLREISVEDTIKLSRDTINQMYLNVMALAKSIDPQLQDDSIYDHVKFNIQNKTHDIWNYIMNIIRGDNGFIQDKYGNRNVFFGTSNVISADIKLAPNPNDENNLKGNEIGLSLFQGAKSYQLQLMHYLKKYFEENINPVSNSFYNLINIDTFKTESGYLNHKTVSKIIDPIQLEYKINNLRYQEFKTSFVVIKHQKKQLAITLLYDLGNIIILFNNINNLKERLNSIDETFNHRYIRPITWSELIYVFLYLLSKGDTNDFWSFTVRYPAIDESSNRPLKVKFLTTTQYRKVILMNTDTGQDIILPNFPNLNSKFIESANINSLTLERYGGDFDGDMLSSTSLFLDESKKEIKDFYQTPRSIIDSHGRFMYNIEYTSKFVIKALSTNIKGEIT